MGVLLHSDWMLVGYFVDFTSPYILKSRIRGYGTLLNNKREVHQKSILKCRDLGKSIVNKANLPMFVLFV